MKKVGLGLLLLVALCSCSRQAGILLQPTEWSFGSIPSYFVARKEVLLSNRGTRPVSLRFISTCDCLHVDHAPGELAAGQTAPIMLSYDPQGQSGFVEAALIVVTRQARRESRIALRAYGKILSAGSQPSR